MKQSLLTLTLASLALSAGAAVNFPNDFSADFESSKSLEGWTIYAPDGEAKGAYADYFNLESKTPCINVNNVNYVFTNCEYMDGAASDTWLITPEFTVTEDEMVISYSYGVIGDSQVATSNRLKLLSSTGGVEKSDFTSTLLLSDLRIKSSDNLSTGQLRYVLKNKKGEKMRLAFVNEGNTTGVIAIADINITPFVFRLNAASSYSSLLLDPSEPTLKMQMNISTPVTATGYTAVLRTASGFETKYEEPIKKFNLNNFSAISFTFPDEIQMQGNSEDYTITFTPNYDGVIPAVIEGTLIRAERKYPMVAVVEELTGSWCGWCPGGIAMLDYWTNLYNGDRGTRVLGIAIHSADPMTISYDDAYIRGYVKQASKVGMETSAPPSIVVNRAGGSAPLQWDMASVMDKKAYATLSITDNATLGEAGDDVTVDFDFTTSFSAEYPGLAIAAVVRENNLKGDDADWAQNNYFASYTLEQISDNYGEDVAPYFERFVSQSSGEIPAGQMVFQEVARGIYPSFEGQNITGAVEDGVANHQQITFPLPDNIADIKNAEVMILLLKQSNGEILAADVMPINVKDNAVDSAVAETSLSIKAEKNVLNVATDSPTMVNVYALDGTQIAKYQVAAGSHTLEVDANDVVIVSATNENTTRTIKTILKH